MPLLKEYAGRQRQAVIDRRWYLIDKLKRFGVIEYKGVPIEQAGLVQLEDLHIKVMCERGKQVED
ncbi:hypothetical protein CHH91_04485 [Virgibacillus sp. 7505]|uniref:hypothetical protein n=1 Tax=Virgibacillus sp. 7505 TaxID=2022548 RepID=UPI000BA709D5|nr:hypothetical protein [Virgibacillus sp. 7505]PAE17269.1 hypothetical protein CHH91_04485 [Virgibacillus sp. 7505]